MAELSAASAVPIATIKYYLREGILPLGDLSKPNQASYSPVHVERLNLTRALIHTGGLSIASVKRVLASIDSDDSLAQVFEVAQNTVSVEPDQDNIDPLALARIDTLTQEWRTYPTNPGRLEAARILGTLDTLRMPLSEGWLAKYAQAALLAAEADLDEVETRPDRDSKAETVIIGTILGDAMFAALRRAAQEHETSRRYNPQVAAAESGSGSNTVGVDATD
ncbi:MerR family transcriptional regulator [Cryobacterium sp. CAN_C3]